VRPAGFSGILAISPDRLLLAKSHALAAIANIARFKQDDVGVGGRLFDREER
jgi:hypothetical protein